MLNHIFIKHFTIIDELNVDLRGGMTVITGETGAGKSVMIDAIEFALGERASPNLIKPGHERTDVTLQFSGIKEALAWLKTHDLDHHDECIIRRTLNKDGRSRYTINGTPCTGKLSRELSELLLSIHGQHAHQALLGGQEQRRLVDQYAQNSALLNETQACYHNWKDINQALEKLKSLNQDADNQLSFLQYQLDELDDVNLQAGDVEKLEKEHKQLHHATQLAHYCDRVTSLLGSDEQDSITNGLSRALQTLEDANTLHPSFNDSIALLKGALIHTEEAQADLQGQHFEHNPERLLDVEKRLSRADTLGRKHCIKPENLHALHETLTQEKCQLEQSDETLQALEKEQRVILEAYEKITNKLTRSRKKTATTLSQLITKKLQTLGMPGGVIDIKLLPRENKTPSPEGSEHVAFHVKTNPEQPFLPLQKVVSGGELSRISLAIQVITAQRSSIPTLIFDEVDVGIGGGTAEIVGNLLRELGEKNQLLCVTHLPQVASKGHQHLLVEKTQENKHTHTQIKTLNTKEKILEIARMLGGLEVTQHTLAHAKDMLCAQE